MRMASLQVVCKDAMFPLFHAGVKRARILLEREQGE
jgi:hypothetical protein